MSGKIFTLNIVSKRHCFLFRYRLLQHALHGKRCCSSKDATGAGDGSSKQQDIDSKKKDEKFPSSDQNLETKTEEPISAREKTKEAAKNKLFSLLQQLEVTPKSSSRANSLNLARAVSRPLKKERFREILEKKKMTPSDELQNAAKAVADSVSGDPTITLAELNEKLGALNLAKRTHEVPEEPAEEVPEQEESMENVIFDEEASKTIMSSVAEVAASVTDKATPINSELGRRLFKLSLEKKTTPTQSVDDLVKSMKIENGRPERPGKDSIEQVETGRGGQTRQLSTTKINLFQSPPLDIFKIPVEGEIIDTKQTVWQCLEEKRLKLLVQYAPTNAFEEMIMWTEQGKHWKFPINNQAEMLEEENVGFHEHVFLEQHLHGFPTKGPIRYFMELVCVGLSKNCYISVDRKLENINWFRDYFREKEDILKEAGALG